MRGSKPSMACSADAADWAWALNSILIEEPAALPDWVPALGAAPFLKRTALRRRIGIGYRIQGG